MDTKAATSAALTTVATTGFKALAGALVLHGYMNASGTEAFVGAGVALVMAGVSFWKDYGRTIAVASLDLLRAKVQFAAAKARANQGTAAASLSSLDAHVTATAPAGSPSSAPLASLILLALGLSTLAIGCSPAAAQAVQVVAPKVHHVVRPARIIPLPVPRAAGLEAFAAGTAPAPAAKPGTLTTAAAESNPIQLLQKFSVDDLNAALADAQAQNPPDTTSINCYTALIPIVQSNIANPLPAGPGVFQLAQKVRDFKALTANLQSPTGPLASLNQACAAWVLDGVNTFIGLGAKVGLVAGTGGLGGVLPAAGGLGLLPLSFKLP